MPATVTNYFYDLPEEIRRRIELIAFCLRVGFPGKMPCPGHRELGGLETTQHMVKGHRDAARYSRVVSTRAMLYLWRQALPPLWDQLSPLIEERETRWMHSEEMIKRRLGVPASARLVEALAPASYYDTIPLTFYVDAMCHRDAPRKKVKPLPPLPWEGSARRAKRLKYWFD